MTSQRTRDRMLSRLREQGIKDEVTLAALNERQDLDTSHADRVDRLHGTLLPCKPVRPPVCSGVTGPSAERSQPIRRLSTDASVSAS